MTRTAAFIINRTRVRDLGALRRASRAAAFAAGWELQMMETTVPEAGDAATRRATAGGAELIVAAGGDGTVRACAAALAGTAIALGIVPLGTANIAALALGLPLTVEEALRVALGGDDRRIDVGEAEGMAFIAMAGIGLDADVVRSTPPILKERLGWVGYALGGLRRLSGPLSTFSLRLDGGPEVRCRARCVVAGSAGLLPGGFALLPGARIDDGLLDVGILAPRNAAGWARVGWRVLAGNAGSDGLLIRHRARRLVVETAAPLPRQADGELLEPGVSLHVGVRRRALIVRVPRSRGTRGVGRD